MSKDQQCLILDMPVLHSGYIQLFERWSHRIGTVYLLGEEFVPLGREIRAIDVRMARRLILSLNCFRQVRVLKRDDLPHLCKQDVVLVSNQLTRRFAEEHLVGCQIHHDTAFLRHDEESVFSQSPPEGVRVSDEVFDKQAMALAEIESGASSCWWRHVGAVLMKDEESLIRAFNEHLPSEHTPYAFGDPRDFVRAGERSEIASSIHAEQAIIAEAAKKGISLEGSSLYVTVFPCPVCAKLVALSGVKRVFFKTGHASLEGDAMMAKMGVELIRVEE